MPPIDLGDLGQINVTSENAKKLTENLTNEERQHLHDALNATETISSSIPGRDLLPEDDSLRSRVDADPVLQGRAHRVGLEMREADGQTWYNFTKLPSRKGESLAYMTKDLHASNRSDAKVQCAAVGGALPEDIDRSNKNKYPGDEDNTLYPAKSDYDAIIETLPGDSVKEKGALFAKLMGMSGVYGTDTIYSAKIGYVVDRGFGSGARFRSCLHVDGSFGGGQNRAVRKDLSL